MNARSKVRTWLERGLTINSNQDTEIVIHLHELLAEADALAAERDELRWVPAGHPKWDSVILHVAAQLVRSDKEADLDMCRKLTAAAREARDEWVAARSTLKALEKEIDKLRSELTNKKP